MIDNRPNQLADSHCELSVAEGTRLKDEDTGPGGGFAVLEAKRLRLARIREELSVRMPTGPVALRLPTGTPVVELLRTVYSTAASRRR
jgi:GntR family transcriptional regulator